MKMLVVHYIFTLVITQILTINAFKVSTVNKSKSSLETLRSVEDPFHYSDRASKTSNKDVISSRSKRQSRIDREVGALYSICSVKEQDLNDLLNIMNGTNLSDTLYQNKSSGERCKQLLQDLREAAQKLIKNWRQAQTSSNNKIKSEYEAQIKLLKVKLNELEDKDRKTKTRLDLTLTKYQQLHNNLKNAQNIIENVRQELKGQTVRLCGALIQGDQTDLAATEFGKLSDAQAIIEIIRNGYDGDVNNLPKLIKFIDHLGGIDKWNQASVGYTSLYEEMKRNNHLNRSELFTLAYKIKAILSDTSIENSSKNKFERLRNRLPSAVDAIVWGQVCLKCRVFNEYFYPGADDLAADKDNRKLFTWVPKQDGKFHEGYWIFEPSTADTKYFRIKNIHYDEYLISGNALLEENKREVYTWRPKTCTNEQCMWEITLNDENSILLRNVHFKEYLYNSYDLNDNDRRKVFTWKLGTHDQQSVWEIMVC